MSAGDGTFGLRIKAFHRGEKNKHKTIPWKVVGRGGEPKWARERCCRREPGRLGAGELGMGRSSGAVPSRKAEGPLVVWFRLVVGGAKKLGRWSAPPKKGSEGNGCCPRAGVIASEAVEGAMLAKGADDISEIPAI